MATRCCSSAIRTLTRKPRSANGGGFTCYNRRDGILGQRALRRRAQRAAVRTHGVVETPVFMPVGTYGTVKAMAPNELAEVGAQIVLGNTFHLWLRPGIDVIAAHGGLNRFMGWDRPLLTDSGGFQVFSLGPLRKVSEEGVAFASPVDGDRLFLTPEISIDVQRALDSDIAMVFDECTPYPATRDEAAASMQMSLRWARAVEGRARRQSQRAVRHRAGRHVRGPSRRIARRH